MYPRLRSSILKRSQPFPADLTKLIKETVDETFHDYLNGNKSLVEGKIFNDEIWLRIGFRKSGELTQRNFEGSINKTDQTNTTNSIHKMLDFLSTLVEEHFSSTEEVEYPKTWTSYSFENTEVFFQQTSENSELEQEANRLLGIDESFDLEAITPLDQELAGPHEKLLH